MYKGKRTCKILKEIRQEIARANDIDLMTSECRYQGDCKGTCPKCEAEVAYLEQQLHQRHLAGKTVMLSGIAAGMLTLSGCKGGETPPPASTNSGTETTASTSCSTEAETGTGVWASILGIESQVSPRDGEGEWQGEVIGPLEGDVPYTPPEEEELAGAVEDPEDNL